jgi:hypothetical protein
MLGLDRFIPYLALEAYAWLQYAAHSRDARRYRNGYQTLSSRVARAPFSAVRPTGDFAYYERMSHYAESGAFDRVTGAPLDPETDTTTYNGATWLLARRTFWADPDEPPDTASIAWNQAIEFYIRRAYGTLYRWSWRSAEFEYAEFRQLLRGANDSNRQSLTDLGVVLANHLLSTVDAYVTVRVRRGAESGPGGGAAGWSIAGSIPLSHLRR